MTSPQRWARGPLELVVGPEAFSRTLARAFTYFLLTFAATIVSTVALADGEVPRWLALLAIPTVAIGLASHRWGDRWSPRTYFLLCVGPSIAVAPVLSAIGPDHAEAAAFLSAGIVGFFLFHTFLRALVIAVILLGGYAVVLARGDYPTPLATWVLVTGITVSVAGLAGWIASHLYVLADNERRAAAEVERLASELSTANELLQQYVASPVAAALRTPADLQPHRRQIAVWFCDLRGFTGFTAGAEPEEVVDVLGEYYAAVGDHATAAGSTIGSFAGDGIHGYFGDPAPRDDPAGAALELALELRPALDTLCARWADRGYHLGYGIGIAYGYATLGTVGYEGRRDYTALGSVVNLAARLCGEAASGEIILDARAHDAVKGRVEMTRRDVHLKGFAGDIPAFSVHQ